MTPKQEVFVREYLIDLNATAAARRAGYAHATTQGPRLLENVGIAAAIKEHQDKRAKKLEITADRVVREFARVGFSDIRVLMKWGEDRVTFIPSGDLDEDAAAIVSGVKSKTKHYTDKEGGSETTVELELKTYDKVSALTQIGRHLGMFKDRMEVDVSELTDEQRMATLTAIADAARARGAG